MIHDFVINFFRMFLYRAPEERIDHLFALGYLLLERVSPIVKQRFFREEFGLDVTFKIFDTTVHYLINTTLSALASLLVFKLLQQALLPVQGFFQIDHPLKIENLFLWLLFVMGTRDFLGYWVHYGFHRFRFLWNFHVFHHSPVKLDWFSGQRGDILEGFIMEAVVSLPLLFIAMTDHDLLILFIYNKNYEYMIHSNVKYPVQGWGKYLNNNHAHWWHHSGALQKPYGQNFGYYTLIWDRLFGTYYVEDGYPGSVGIPYVKDYPANFFKRMAYPYLKLLGGGSASA